MHTFSSSHTQSVSLTLTHTLKLSLSISLTRRWPAKHLYPPGGCRSSSNSSQFSSTFEINPAPIPIVPFRYVQIYRPYLLSIYVILVALSVMDSCCNCIENRIQFLLFYISISINVILDLFFLCVILGWIHPLNLPEMCSYTKVVRTLAEDTYVSKLLVREQENASCQHYVCHNIGTALYAMESKFCVLMFC